MIVNWWNSASLISVLWWLRSQDPLLSSRSKAPNNNMRPIRDIRKVMCTCARIVCVFPSMQQNRRWSTPLPSSLFLFEILLEFKDLVAFVKSIVYSQPKLKASLSFLQLCTGCAKSSLRQKGLLTLGQSQGGNLLKDQALSLSRAQSFFHLCPTLTTGKNSVAFHHVMILTTRPFPRWAYFPPSHKTNIF